MNVTLHSDRSGEQADHPVGCPIYLDGFATLPLAPSAGLKMIEAWGNPGNAGSPHLAGERAARLIADSRDAIAALIGAGSNEVFFTSGATEANNLALLGAAVPNAKRRKIIISAIEHKSVLAVATQLGKLDFEIAIAPVDRFGLVNIAKLDELVDENTLLVSVMTANNETGIVQPISDVVSLAHARGALVHSDGAQAVGKIPIDVFETDIDYLTFSSHKMYGPMGIGALYMSSNAPRLLPQTYGGGQQAGLRAGTEPVPLIAGFGEAARLAIRDLESTSFYTQALSSLLFHELTERKIRCHRIADEHLSIPGSLILSFDDAKADDLCIKVSRKISISSNSACTAGQIRSSHVLDAMGFSSEDAERVVRIFCHRYLTESDIVEAAIAIEEAIII